MPVPKREGITMDITCATCGEPWDTYHLRHDEVYETEAGQTVIEDELNLENYEKAMATWGGLGRRAARKTCPKPTPAYTGEMWNGVLTPFWRQQYGKKGWAFGPSIYAVLKCPCCFQSPREREPLDGSVHRALPDAEDRKALRIEVAELLEGDEDGIATELADLAERGQ